MSINLNYGYIIFFSCINLLFLLIIFRRLKKNKKDTPSNTELSLEIDHNLNLLHDFWKKVGVSSIEEPMTLTQALNKSQRVVVEDPLLETIHVIRKDFYLTDPPSWHRKIFDKPTSLDALSDGKQQGVRQFYDKLGSITSTYEKLRTSNGESIINELENKLEDIVIETLKRGNPLTT